jgi:hypothetical protein
MDFKHAIKTLELNSPFSLNELKKNYYRLSLKWHPDKNKSIEATNKFQDIQNAYEYLNEYIRIKNETDNDFISLNTNVDSDDDKNDDNDKKDFFSLFGTFVKTISGNTINKTMLKNILKNITENCGKISIKIFEGLDKDTSIKLYDYLHQYADILHINQETLDEIKVIIKEKFKHDNIIVLHPKLNNLINDELYKLEFDDKTYCIPLWHDEIIYDLSCSQLIVKILPVLDDHITIDSNNNVIVNLSTKIRGLITSEKISFKLCDRFFDIPCDELKIKKNQKHIFKKKGIPVINQNDIYNISERSNIVVHLTLIDE